MAATNALNVVRQIQALADEPPRQEMRDCLDKVASSLMFFLGHPDSQVRLGSARTLAKLSADYPEEFHKLDLSRLKATLLRCRAAAEEGSESDDGQELRLALTAAMGEVDKSNGAVAAPVLPAGDSGGTPGGGDSGPPEGRGEVILKIAEETDSKAKAFILERTVKLDGVVSVTFEGDLVIVSARTPAKARDARFLADLLAVVKEQGLQGVSLVTLASATPATADDSPVSVLEDSADESDGQEGGAVGYLDDDDEEPAANDAPWGQSRGSGLGGGLGGLGAAGGYRGIGSAGMPGQGYDPQWSFFSQNHWMTGRRVQEFGDDPSIAARLAAAKQKETERQQESQTRLSKLSAWWGGR
jgi:hypothetical protein